MVPGSEDNLSPTSQELVTSVEELDRLEALRETLGPRFLLRQIFLGLFSGAAFLSIFPIALGFTPIEYGLPWFVAAISGGLAGWSAVSLARGISERRRLDTEIEGLTREVSVAQLDSGSEGEAS